jgi:hypothetical protein
MTAAESPGDKRMNVSSPGLKYQVDGGTSGKYNDVD